MVLNPQELTDLIIDACEDKKAYGVTVLDISEISTIADYFVICSGRSKPHVQAIVENIQEKLGERQAEIKRVEGFKEATWVLIDCGDVVVHVFQETERQFYNLERLWGDARVVGLP
ncbi:iojap-like protein [Desulfofarcimen acetoxidans DSM 771]|uniref:Ribosomal silencing factor RsfS n=1 Tax=Desulfofarcimen acetoxidans (strain ATCC 49208 / DSM 771 / KCTC 5769 / VKM B-1644 / 5575) TaxID=485916 RepID=C8W5N8_DESAS|nr:ribosome silencing factor [Desulfofarcimen acetoxidans]ACV64038.1 iojap-like protein [Desulfofarcimen acetoxidans DSM 771]